MNIIPLEMNDYDEVMKFWHSVEGISLNECDTPEAIDAFLRRNPGFSVVVKSDEGEIIGAVLCGHNGRSGHLYHLSISPEYRNKGVAQKMIDYTFAKLAEANISRCNIFVYIDNTAINEFWLRTGWVDPADWKVLQKRIDFSKYK